MNTITSAVKTLVLEISAGKFVQVTPEQVALFNTISRGEAIERKAHDKVTTATRAQLVVMYGDIAPTYDQYRGDLNAIKAQCLKAGVKEKYSMDVYAETVALIYGDKLTEAQKDIAHGANSRLPLSRDKESVALRAKRQAEKVAKAQVAESTAPTKADDASKKVVQENEAIEQYVAKVGVQKILAACQHILDSDDSTKMQAKVIAGMLKELQKKLAKLTDATVQPTAQEKKVA